MNTIKIAIAEGKKKYRDYLIQLLNAERDFEVVIVAKNGKQLIERLSNGIKPDIILMDIEMPVMNGVDTAKALLDTNHLSRIIVWTMFEDECHFIKMTKIGVKSFLGKNDLELLPKTIRVVYGGGVYYPDRIAYILKTYLERETVVQCPLKLSSFEIVMVRAICKGYSSNKIGSLINKSHRTVEDYRSDLYRRFEVTNKEQFVVFATKWGLV